MCQFYSNSIVIVQVYYGSTVYYPDIGRQIIDVFSWVLEIFQGAPEYENCSLVLDVEQGLNLYANIMGIESYHWTRN